MMLRYRERSQRSIERSANPRYFFLIYKKFAVVDPNPWHLRK